VSFVSLVIDALPPLLHHLSNSTDDVVRSILRKAPYGQRRVDEVLRAMLLNGARSESAGSQSLSSATGIIEQPSKLFRLIGIETGS